MMIAMTMTKLMMIVIMETARMVKIRTRANQMGDER